MKGCFAHHVAADLVADRVHVRFRVSSRDGLFPMEEGEPEGEPEGEWLE